jgi:hypothetical protein
MARCLTIIFLIITAKAVFAQSPTILRQSPAFHALDRMQVLGMADSTSMDLSVSNVRAKDAVSIIQSAWNNTAITNRDRYDFDHILADFIYFVPKDDTNSTINSNEETITWNSNDDNSDQIVLSSKRYERSPVLKYFYKTRAHFFTIETPTFSAYINPIVKVDYTKQANNSNTVFENTRGVDIQAYFDKKIYLYTQILENQRSFLDYVDDRILKYGTIPGQAAYKPYTSSVLDNLRGYDYFTAKAYFGFKATKSINVELGHNNHFIGNGHRSLLLSDYGPNYFNLNIQSKFWKFHYQNIFAELSPTTVLFNSGDILLPKKYAAFHYLSFQPSPKFEVGVFESVIFARPNHFEFQYLNPIILYRAVEHTLDSPDNVLIGANIRWNPIKGVSLYGQLILDEFNLREVRAQSGWWANKFGGQLGLKYYNAFGVDHLDLQAEVNSVRPYTYAHRDTLPISNAPLYYSVGSYATHNQPLAHLLGANFNEWIGIVRYRPTQRLFTQIKTLFSNYGGDSANSNWGNNILLPLQSIERVYGNVIGQGISTRVRMIQVDCSYEVRHNYHVYINGAYRTTHTDGVLDKQHYLGGGIRINLAQTSYDY